MRNGLTGRNSHRHSFFGLVYDSFLESIELVISALQRTQYDPHVASAHRFEMLFFLVWTAEGTCRDDDFLSVAPPPFRRRTRTAYSALPGINRRGQAQVNGHEGQAEEPKRECNCDEELDEHVCSWADVMSHYVQRQT